MRRFISILLVASHIALSLPISEVCAMESANFKVEKSAVSSGSGENTGTGSNVTYSDVAGSVAGDAESPSYKVSLGYIHTVSSDPPVFKGLIPDANMRIVWDKGQRCPAAISLDAYFTSPDNSPLRYEVEGNMKIAADINPASHVASFSQGADFSGSEAVRFVAIDSDGNRTRSNFVILTVKALSANAPVIYPIDNITVNENELASVTPAVFDPDGDALTVTYSSPLDDGGRWQTDYNDAGVYKVTVSVSDGALKASASFTVTVKNVNRPPVIDPISDIAADEGDIVKLNPAAYDPDGDNVVISYPSPFDVNGAWQTTHKDAGMYRFTISASDGNLSAAREVVVTVNPVNVPPVVRISADKTNVLPDEDFTVYIEADDADGDRLKLTIKKDGETIAGCDGILLDGQAYTKTISIANAGSHTIGAVVEEVDAAGAANTAAASLRINVDENSSNGEYFPISGDFNGDGLADLGYYNRTHGIWKVQLSNGDGTFGELDYWINASDNFGVDGPWFYPVTGDFNGDSRTDVGFIRVPTNDGLLESYIRIATSTGKDFSIKSGYWRQSEDGSLKGDWRFVAFSGDFNGDGMTDIAEINYFTSKLLYVDLTLEGLDVARPDLWSSGSGETASDFAPMAADFNGDGLTDACFFTKSGARAGRWTVALSNGKAFGDTVDWLYNFGPDKDPMLGDFNFDGLTDIGYMEEEGGQWSIKYALSNGKAAVLDNGNPYTYRTDISDSLSGSFLTADFNGDGLFDVAFFDKHNHKWSVKLHHSKYPDLLVGIDNGIGGATTITYKDSTAFENNGSDGLPALPFAIRVVSTVTQADGLGESYTASYFYRDGFFDSEAREFRGFGYVRVTDAEGSSKETYFNQDDIYKGRPAREVVRDRYDRIYSQVSYNWQYSVIASPPQAGEAIFFPYLLDKTSSAYDPLTGVSKSARTAFAYDDYGNATNVKEEGFLDVSGDERESVVTYYYDVANWILSKPLESRVKDAQGSIVAATKYEYYPDGSLKKEERWLGQPGSAPQWGASDNPTAEFTYGGCGNVETVKDGRGNVTTTAYDDTKTFPATVQNALMHAQSFTYNKATGKILTSTDPNGQVATSEYDGFGRLIHVTGPGNISETTYIYDLASRPARIKVTTSLRGGATNADEAISSYSFVDGLGRQILSRVEAEYRGTPKHIVSGETRYDSRGQVIRKHLPYYIDVPTPEDAYIPPQNTTPSVSYEYDAMGRLVKTVRPDNKASYTIYGVNMVEAVNENGQRARQTKDAYGRIVEVEEETGDLTNYAYDTLGNLTDTYDSATPRNRVHMEYDTLGRKVSMTDPDMGNWSYYYDRVGNLKSQVDAKGQTITFEYDAINRLISKSTSVTYTYDDTSKPNCIGRLSKVTDSSGSTEFFYDILGRETKTTKTISSASYTIERAYDSLDRLTTVKYPDNTVVGYAYNKQGGIDKIGTVPGLGSPLGGDCPYFVTGVDYNANGQIERIHYGNGTSTDYAYDPYNFRLDTLKTRGPQNAPIQDLSYNFDPIGNITSILDGSHTNTQHFQYDSLNRLVQANGASYGVINYQYDSIGNLLQKGGLTMQYGQLAGPHAVTTVRKDLGGVTGQSNHSFEVFSVLYDSNGNMTAKGSNSFEYDVENRLTKALTEKGGEPFELTLDFTAGWNFFSLPGFIPNTGGSIKDILSPIEGKYDQISTYDTASGKWLHYVGDVKFNQFDKFEIGRGYLIYIKEPCTLNLAGSFPATGQVRQLKSGWNLVAAPTDSEIEPSRAFRGVTYDSIAEYNGSTYTYNPTTLQKGHAYWVHITSDQSWNVPLTQVETTYTYDGDGGRVMRHTPGVAEGLPGGVDGLMTVYIGSSYELEGVPGQSPDKITKHIFMGSTRVCSIEHLRGGTGPSNSSSEVFKAYYYHQDHIGSSNVITDETGAIVNILEYSPFGEVSRNTGDYSTDKRFTGKIWDESSALSYFGARYYDPELGRFITADPTIAHPFDPQDLNRYSYCRNNPVNYVDPTGLSWWSAFWDSLSGGVGAIIAAVAIIVVTAVANVFTGGALTSVLVGEIFGAIGGATGAAATGGDIGRGMLIGTVVGGVTGGILGSPGSAAGGFVQSGVGDVVSWSINAAGPTMMEIAATVAGQAIITSGVGAGAAVVNSEFGSKISSWAERNIVTPVYNTVTQPGYNYGMWVYGEKSFANFVGASLDTAYIGSGVYGAIKGVAANGAQYWQYYPEGNPGYSSPYLTRGWQPPHEVGKEAYNALRLDLAKRSNPGTAVRRVDVKWWEPVAGGRTVRGGTGREFYRGRFTFPDD